MRGLIRRLSRRTQPKRFDMEKAVGRYLLTLPRCTKKVVVASPIYSDNHYRCEVHANASGLLQWAERHARGVSSLDPENQAARLTLPIWLRGHDPSDAAPSFVPAAFADVMRPYVLEFVQRGITEVFCPGCHRFTQDITMKDLNQQHLGPWSFWTSEWHCHCGLLLYREEHELHFIRK